VLKVAAGEVIVGELKRRTARTLELGPLNPDEPDRMLATEDVAWIARIVWVRQ